MGMSYNEYRIMATEDIGESYITWVYKEFKTKAEVKSYMRHFKKENPEYEKYRLPIELTVQARLNDEDYGSQSEWIDISDHWDLRAREEQELWCERKGIDPNKFFYGEW